MRHNNLSASQIAAECVACYDWLVELPEILEEMIEAEVKAQENQAKPLIDDPALSTEIDFGGVPV